MFEDTHIKETGKPLAEAVADQIISMIAEGRLSSGEKLPNEFELAEKLNVGRGTIREAVKLLVSRNILVIKRGYGTFVVDQPGVIKDPYGLSLVNDADKDKMLRDMFDLRRIIEPVSAEYAAIRATDEELAKLSSLYDEFKKLVLDGKNYDEVDKKLHAAIAEYSHNYFLAQITPTIMQGVLLSNRNVRQSYVKDLDYLKTVAQTHQSFVDCIIRRDPFGARDAMLRHLLDTEYLHYDSQNTSDNGSTDGSKQSEK